jgi:hypothetical protein
MQLVPKPNKTHANRKRIEYLLAELMEGYVATMDCPAACITEELMATFPDAVVIATTRDPKSWWKSMEYVHKLTANMYLPLLLVFVPRVRKYFYWLAAFRQLAHWRYGSDVFDQNGIVMHEEYLRKVVPPGKLFWYDVKTGWEPLCRILDVPVPDVPFPHNNSKTEAQKTHDELVAVGVFAWAVVVVGAVAGVWALLRLKSWMF